MANPRFFYDNRFADTTPVASSNAAGNGVNITVSTT
jgi:hypothetical protein